MFQQFEPSEVSDLFEQMKRELAEEKVCNTGFVERSTDRVGSERM